MMPIALEAVQEQDYKLPRELHVPPPIARAGPRKEPAAQDAHLHAYKLLQ